MTVRMIALCGAATLAFAANDQGRIDVPVTGSGRYLLSTSHDVEGARALGGKDVAKTYHISTLTFVAP